MWRFGAVYVAFHAACSGTCGGNLTRVLIDGVLTISGSGEMGSYISFQCPMVYCLRNVICAFGM